MRRGVRGSELHSQVWGSGASFCGGGRTCRSALAWSYLERDSAPKDYLQGKVTPAERLGVGWAAEGKAGG